MAYLNQLYLLVSNNGALVVNNYIYSIVRLSLNQILDGLVVMISACHKTTARETGVRFPVGETKTINFFVPFFHARISSFSFPLLKPESGAGLYCNVE